MVKNPKLLFRSYEILYFSGYNVKNSIYYHVCDLLVYDRNGNFKPKQKQALFEKILPLKV